MTDIDQRIEKMKDDNSILIAEAIRTRECLGGKIDAIKDRMDRYQADFINLSHTIYGNELPGLKSRQAVTESWVKLIGGGLGVIVLAVIIAYFKLKA